MKFYRKSCTGVKSALTYTKEFCEKYDEENITLSSRSKSLATDIVSEFILLAVKVFC